MRAEVQIEKIVAGGDGLGRHDGRVVFVPGTAPGERHLVEAQQEKKDYIKARSVSRIESSPERREPPCPYYEPCGGCSLMHLSPEPELRIKSGILAESLDRAGVSYGVIPTVPSPEAGYRTRLRFHVSRAGELSMGFRKRGTHVVEDIERCLVASETLNEVWQRIRVWARERPEWTRGLTSIEIQESSHEPGRAFARFLVRSDREIHRFDSRQRNELLAHTSLEGAVFTAGDRGAEVRAGRPVVYHRVGPWLLRQSAGSFFQANRFLLEKLVSAVVPERPVSRFVDLYCGAGLFAVPAAGAAGGEVVGVESSASAVRDAKANARAAGHDRVRFLRADAARFAQRFAFTERDYVTLDPPRGGLPRALRQALGSSPLREFCYVSCDAPSFGRDAAHFQTMGFRLVGLELLDLFPGTHHFETVARFSRRAALDLSPEGGRYYGA